jgi:hypothetical protein
MMKGVGVAGHEKMKLRVDSGTGSRLDVVWGQVGVQADGTAGPFVDEDGSTVDSDVEGEEEAVDVASGWEFVEGRRGQCWGGVDGRSEEQKRRGVRGSAGMFAEGGSSVGRRPAVAEQ